MIDKTLQAKIKNPETSDEELKEILGNPALTDEELLAIIHNTHELGIIELSQHIRVINYIIARPVLSKTLQWAIVRLD